VPGLATPFQLHFINEQIESSVVDVDRAGGDLRAGPRGIEV
jgi:hypothetical protein